MTTRLAGVAPLTPRLERWQETLLADADGCEDPLAEHGSPVNLIHTDALGANVAELRAAAERHGLELGVYFARKANKCLAFVDRAAELGCGIDVASEQELNQVLDRGVDPARIVVTAAVKPRSLLDLCARSGVLVVVDGVDELEALEAAAAAARTVVPIAYRLAVSSGSEGRPPTRFGISPDEIPEVHGRFLRDGPGERSSLRLDGLQFHIDGYAAADRVRGGDTALRVIDALGEAGSSVRFVDIGGGVPMRYLDHREEWSSFCNRHRAALAGEGEPLTYLGHDLGFSPEPTEAPLGVYPAWQDPVRGEWLDAVLESLAPALRERGLELRCEPGRALLDGCGMTLARVEFRKRGASGAHLVGLAMNRTQMRTTAADSMMDPLLVRPGSAGTATEPFEGYLVGAYCIEREFLSWRRLTFPAGAAVGDIVAFPNTAGYFMHILESSSHQMPLAANVVLSEGSPRPDPIDAR